MYGIWQWSNSKQYGAEVINDNNRKSKDMNDKMKNTILL
jgi:hypothetical protein